MLTMASSSLIDSAERYDLSRRILADLNNFAASKARRPVFLRLQGSGKRGQLTCSDDVFSLAGC